MSALPTKKSNDDRARLRAECRRRLADHIGQELQIVVAPEHVRLVTRPEDRYRWAIRPSATYLFERPLSKHGVAAYQEIYNSVGEKFKAIPKENGANALNTVWEPDADTGGRIQTLEERVITLEDAAQRWQGLAEAAEAGEAASDASLRDAIRTNESLRGQLQDLRHSLGRLKSLARYHSQKSRWLGKAIGEIGQTIKTIEKYKPSPVQLKLDCSPF